MASKRKLHRLTDLQKRLARIARDEYISQRNMFANRLRVESVQTGRNYTGSKTFEKTPHQYKNRWYKTVWRALAVYFDEKRISPAIFMYAQFAYLVTGAPPPYPNHFLGVGAPYALRNYKKAVKESKKAIQQSLGFQREKARAEIERYQSFFDWDIETATATTLRDPNISLSALFRYCLASRMPNKRTFGPLAKLYEEAASVQYIPFIQEYDEIWGDWIPKEFREEHHRLYNLPNNPSPSRE